jgi:nicotinate-nucleotide adenylyltransferase
MNAVIFSGSFNPIHAGHVAIAGYVVGLTSIDEFWFVVSPHNPFKSKDSLADFHHRMNMVKIAFEGLELPVVVSDIENTLSRPSYTVNTIDALAEKYPDRKWSLLIGADNLADFHLWKNYEKIITRYRLLVYPRAGFDGDELCKTYRATKINAPMMEISSTFIRDSISEGHDPGVALPYGVFEYIHEHGLYTKKNDF